MSAQEDLTARFPSKAGYHPRDVTHDGRMEGQFWFFEKKRSNAIEKDPEKTEQAQGSVRELFLRLPASVGPPMLIEALEVRYTPNVPIEYQFPELRNSDAKGFPDAAESRLSGIPWRPGQLLEEVSPIRVAYTTDGSIGLADELGNEMEVADLREELTNLTKASVRVNLLQVGLREAAGVVPIVVIGPLDDDARPTTDEFSRDDWSALVILRELDPVMPVGGVEIKSDIDDNVGVAACME